MDTAAPTSTGEDTYVDGFTGLEAAAKRR